MKTIDSIDFNTGAFPIWRGFRHNWQYNHRTNRLGSFIDIENGYHKTFHSGASGTGIDSLSFQDYYTLVKADNTNYHIGKVRFKSLKGKEGKTISFSEKFKIKLSAEDKDLPFGVFLNGFDLLSNTKSDKLHIFSIDISETSRTNQYITYTISGEISLDCKSPECQLNEKSFDYKLDVYFLLVKSSDLVYERSSGAFTNEYNWKTKKKHELNLFENGQKEDVLFLQNNLKDYPVYAIGYRRMQLQINNRSHGKDTTVHMLDLNMNIKNFRPLAQNQILINQEIFFRNWRKNMKKINFHSSWAFRQKGSFKGESKLAVLRFKDAEIITTGINEGKIDWKGNNANPNDSDSIKKIKIIKIDAKKLLA